MKCLVTGGAGFIGSNLVDRLIDDDHDVIVIDNLSTGKIENINPKAEFIDDGIGLENITDFSMFKNIDIVFHLAARARVQPSIENPLEFNRTNVDGTLNMLKASADMGVKRFVYSSSSSVYGDVKHLPTSENVQLKPMSPYALQKLITEKECGIYSDVYDLDTVCLRYFNVYSHDQTINGPYATAISNWMHSIRNNIQPYITGDGEQRRDMINVSDVVDVNIFCMKQERSFCGAVYDVGTGANISLNEIKEIVNRHFPDIDFKYTAARDGDVMLTCANVEPLRELGWRANIGVEDGIDDCFRRLV